MSQISPDKLRGSKICRKCAEGKPLAHFSVKAENKDGLQTYCKPCFCEYQRQYRKNKPHTVKKHNDLRKGYMASWYEANKGSVSKRNAEKYKANPQWSKDKARKWGKDNPLAIRAIKAKRRSRQKNAGGTYTAEDVKDLIKRQRCKCAICKDSLKYKFHVDHITPLMRGGRNDRRNLQLLCPPCNMRKNAKDPLDFMRSEGFLL